MMSSLNRIFLHHPHPRSLYITPSRRSLQTSVADLKEKSGKYKISINRSKPLTYEMSFRPSELASHKGWNSWNTAQLEDTMLKKEEIGQDLPNKMILEDMFIRRFINGTFPEMILSEVMIKRQLNLIRISAITNRSAHPKSIYFLIGFAEEILSFWLKAPVKMELQTTASPEDVVYKYI